MRSLRGFPLRPAQVSPINIGPKLFAGHNTKGLAVNFNRELFPARLVPIRNVCDVLPRRVAPIGKLFSPANVHRHEVSFQIHGDMITEQLMNCNNRTGNSQAVNAMAKLTMDIKEIRLLRLRELIRDKYDGYAGRFADAHGMKRPQVSRWVTTNDSSRQGIAEESARAIEQKEGKPAGWMDRPDDSIYGMTIAPLAARVFALPCTKCGHVSHKSFIDLEMNDAIPCGACGNSINVASYYGQSELAEFLKSLGGIGFTLCKR